MQTAIKFQLSSKFLKQLHKAPTKIQEQFKRALAIFLQNNTDTSLRNHPLKGNYKGYRSINITSDWRALYTEIESNGETIAHFEFLGTHSELYK